jgi:methylated-DNA-[protein]-cysteine S-methyltransferase
MILAPEQHGIHTCTIDTPLGIVTAFAQNNNLTELHFRGQKYHPAGAESGASGTDYMVFNKLRSWLSDYFDGIAKEIDFRLDPQGTAFQKRVWSILLKIPFGRVTTYGEIARVVATASGLSAMSAQAIGQAVGHNPISILIPCHRVIGSDRSLVGYAAGLDIKRALLQAEKVDLKSIELIKLANRPY